MNIEEWYEFRDIVLSANWDQKLSRFADRHETHEITILVKEYLETDDSKKLDLAAMKTALLKDGVTDDVARNHYWLVLEKS